MYTLLNTALFTTKKTAKQRSVHSLEDEEGALGCGVEARCFYLLVSPHADCTYADCKPLPLSCSSYVTAPVFPDVICYLRLQPYSSKCFLSQEKVLLLQ